MSTKRGRRLIFALASVLVACCKRTSDEDPDTDIADSIEALHEK